MTESQVVSAFQEYVSAYDPDNQKIRLKIDHTLRVAEMARRIAESVKADVEFAWLSGMLHDIGRFEQIKRYNTFVDADSVDHAELGRTLLFDEGLLKWFVPDLSEDKCVLLEKAIGNHSLYRLPNGLSNEELLYCNILRDADKLDIFRAVCDIQLNDLYGFRSEELKRAAVSEEVKACFYKHSAVLKSLWKTPTDNLVAHICLVFELVFPISRRLAREEGYVDQLLEFESENKETAAWFNYMRENLWREVLQCSK